MRRSVLLLTILGVIGLCSRGESKTVWPDTVDNRDPVAYFVVKIDTTITPLTDSTFKRDVDTTMGKRGMVGLHFDSVYVSGQELQAIAIFIAGHLKGTQQQIQDRLRAGIVVDAVVPKKPKK